MTLPFSLTEKSIKSLVGLGVGGIVGLFALYILWQVFISGQVAISQDISLIKSNMSLIIQNEEQIQNDQKIIMQDHQAMKDAIREAADKEARLLQGICYGVHPSLKARNEYCTPK